jgi:hypothetical protein
MNAGPLAKLRRHLTYANVASTLAVFLALVGGTALAAGLPRNSVGSKTVRDGSLRSVDLADGSGVTGADVVDGSLAGADFGSGSVGGSKLQRGAIGGADLADGSVGAAKLGREAVGSDAMAAGSVLRADVQDGSIHGVDVAPDTLTGKNIVESTLTGVLGARALDGHTAEDFLSSLLFEGSSQEGAGIPLGDGTFKTTVECAAPSHLLSGGPIEVNPTSSLVESFPKNDTWTVRINPHGALDTFSVRVLCAV